MRSKTNPTMNFFKNFTLTPMNMLKASVLLLIGVVALTIVANLVAPFGGSFTNVKRLGMPSLPAEYDGSYAVTDEAGYGYGGGETAKVSSVGGGIIVPPDSGPYSGDDLEDFEVIEYNVSFETRRKERECAAVADLKALPYVVFESANDHDRGCNYAFKVLHENVPEVLTLLQGLGPKDLNENTYTIKRQLDLITSETEILEKKLKSLDDTLESALGAYDDITDLATRTENADALAKIINGRVGVIERLTQERLNVIAQLERLERSKTDQLDRLEYTFFRVSVFENKLVDTEMLKDSWKAAVKEFVREVNRIVQDLSINLLALLLVLAQYILYFFILLLIVKYLWSATKYIWKR